MEAYAGEGWRHFARPTTTNFGSRGQVSPQAPFVCQAPHGRIHRPAQTTNSVPLTFPTPDCLREEQSHEQKRLDGCVRHALIAEVVHRLNKKWISNKPHGAIVSWTKSFQLQCSIRRRHVLPSHQHASLSHCFASMPNHKTGNTNNIRTYSWKYLRSN